ncbi:uncharacterized protein CTRU02_213659 [Colletotrichum truncatum]|uniref:Uncharacterized protein n=1 Tax=Colletotrichum truncatum TaxID=5467 RepID=A0ACC3YGC7_COLTU|nr:uncharacterized protein CTRU02_11765 [Colletotrichum truncatum]KAF6785465.1 hypothetical protein CTRU02_11765 [Colletotrichum truncatum]
MPTASLLGTYDVGLSPAVTPPPNLNIRDKDPVQSVCGYFTLSGDKGIRSRKCAENETCRVSDGFLGCGSAVFTSCANAREVKGCSSGMTVDEKTLCCRETSGIVPACQTFMRDDSEKGLKKMFACRDLDIPWDITVTLHHSTNLLVNARSSTPTRSPPSTPSSGGDLALGSSAETMTPSSMGTSTPSLAFTPTAAAESASGKPSGNDDAQNFSPQPQTSAIVGAVLGAFAFVGVTVCFVAWLFMQQRRRRAQSTGRRSPTPTVELQGDQPGDSAKTEGLTEMIQREHVPTIPELQACRAPADGELGSPNKPAELDS